MEHLVALIQGSYFFISGVWPLVSMSTFLRVTGPKVDLWLVKTVAQVNGEINTAIIILAIGSAFSLAIIELILIAWWIMDISLS